ncbi:MAG: sigma-70 family RNA polymerase sigma factor [Planctomycetes bacterium]|nr:sigma-70 family RNA polymerase sigma factor [Planctomycetota bacterium]
MSQRAQAQPPELPPGQRTAPALRLVWNHDFDQRAAALFADYRASGRPETFRLLVEELAPRLLPLVRGRLRKSGRRVEAREVVDDAFAQVFRRSASFHDRGPGSFVKWFLAIAENLVKQEARATHRRDRRERLAARPEVDRAADPFTLLLAEEEEWLARATWAHLRRLALEAVAKLPRGHWRLLVDFARDGLTYTELAQREGLPRSALVMRIQRARKRVVAHVRRRLDEETSGRAPAAAAPRSAQPPSGPGSATTSSGCSLTTPAALRRTV